MGIRLSFPRRIGNYDAQAVLQKAKAISELELSEFRFMREYQQGLIAYGQDVVRSVAWGVSLALGQDPERFEQAVQLPASDFKKSMEGGETTPLVKAVFSYLADKFGSIKKFYEKFKFRGHSDVDPMTVSGGPITNLETGEVLTQKRWQEIEDSVVGHLRKYLGGIDEEMVVRAGLLQLLRERMTGDGIPVEEQKEMSYDDTVDRYGEQPRTWEEAETPDDSVMKKTLEWARTRAGEYLAIDDGKLRTGIINAVRKRLVDGIQNGDSSEEVARRLFYIDPASEFDMPYSNDTIAAINRDWRRVCFPAGTRVLTSRGPVPIESVKKGDKVITHSGKLHEVVQQHKRVYSGGMTTVTTKSGSTLSATDNHEVYVCRKGKMIWVPISELVVGDKVVRAKGWNTYCDPYWLKGQNHDLGRHCKDIARECGVSPATIRSYMKRFHIPVRRDLSFRGKKHTDGYKRKMRDLASTMRYADRITTKESRDKADRTMAGLRKRGVLSAWNKDKRCPSISEGVRRSFRDGRVTWSKGLTKDTHPSLASSGRKASRRLRSGSPEILGQRRRQSETLAKKIADGFNTFSAAKSGRLVNKSTGKTERYQSSWEKAYMEGANEGGVFYTRNHGIVISYVDDSGKPRKYVPDFFEAENRRLVEIKPSRFVEKNVESTCAKIEAAKKFCTEKGWDFVVLTERELFGQQARV